MSGEERTLAPPRAGWWACPLLVCSFRCYYDTDAGALNGAAKHLLQAHRVRLTLPVRHHGGLLGGGR